MHKSILRDENEAQYKVKDAFFGSLYIVLPLLLRVLDVLMEG